MRYPFVNLYLSHLFQGFLHGTVVQQIFVYRYPDMITIHIIFIRRPEAGGQLSGAARVALNDHGVFQRIRDSFGGVEVAAVAKQLVYVIPPVVLVRPAIRIECKHRQWRGGVRVQGVLVAIISAAAASKQTLFY